MRGEWNLPGRARPIPQALSGPTCQMGIDRSTAWAHGSPMLRVDAGEWNLPGRACPIPQALSGPTCPSAPRSDIVLPITHHHRSGGQDHRRRPVRRRAGQSAGSAAGPPDPLPPRRAGQVRAPGLVRQPRRHHPLASARSIPTPGHFLFLGAETDVRTHNSGRRRRLAGPDERAVAACRAVLAPTWAAGYTRPRMGTDALRPGHRLPAPQRDGRQPRSPKRLLHLSRWSKLPVYG